VPSNAQSLPPVDWSSAHAEAREHLRRLLRFDTTNPPGNELPLARYLEGVLLAEGIGTRVFEPHPNRGAVIARIRGDDSRGAVLLLAHMDVVGVEADKWTVDPFGAETVDGYLYGRGAIDDKGMLAANVMTMVLLSRALKASGQVLSRDVVFVATSDEEAGGEWGIQWLLTHHPELLAAEIALNEGGRIRMSAGMPAYAAVQIAEKISHVVTVTARGPVGHASVPLPDNAVARLARALARIDAFVPPVRMLPSTRMFFAGLSRIWKIPAEARAMADVSSRVTRRIARGAAVLRRTPVFNAVLRAGISPTTATAGHSYIVIPAEAKATLNVRTLPGESLDRLLSVLQRVVDDPMVEIRATARGINAPASSHRSPMFKAIAETVSELQPGLPTVPYLSTGATDSAHLRAGGVQAFGLLPFPLEPGDEARMHGHDERIPLVAFDFGTRLVFGATSRVAR
jgi:acetylornithine deacetylase/succinyl-diaminopimelate desuccinylase-like protein